jgi:8-hydroxy-5-deazaflavin:NADPH oxidoreductase
VFAVPFDAIKQLITKYRGLLPGKVVVDPSNPVKVDANGRLSRALPDGESGGSIIAGLLPAGAHYVKAFGTLDAQSLQAASRKATLAALFYATDDGKARAAVEPLIRTAGFDPVEAGGVQDTARLEAPDGDLFQHGGLNGQLLTAQEARAAVAAGRGSTERKRAPRPQYGNIDAPTSPPDGPRA